MRVRTVFAAIAVGVVLASSTLHASIFGSVSGRVVDPQGQAIAQALVTVRARLSQWHQDTATGTDGSFSILAVPAGEYVLSVAKGGFQMIEEPIEVRSDTVTSVPVRLPLATLTATVAVHGDAETVSTRSTTTETLVTRDEIARAPGAIRTNSLDVVTQFVPGSYMVHDQLHVRGGHQVSWLVDGVPVPNTNIAGNVGPQFDPKDIDSLETQRGGYSAEFGDRTFGVFNVIPRTGFERNREAEIVASYGSFRETNDQFSVGDHSDRLAYYISVSGNRTDLGLETPVAGTFHDRSSGVSGFGSLVYKSGVVNQVRIVGSVRRDDFQIPNDADQQSAGVDDRQRERDGFVNVSWLRGIGSAAFLTVSPFYHYNRAAFDGSTTDPVATTDHRASQYIGAQAVLAAARGRHDARIGAYGFHQRDAALFALDTHADTPLRQTQSPGGHVAVGFAEDQYAAAGWLTLNAGIRVTSYAGRVSESAASPRIGAAVKVPRAGWAVRAFYGLYYQPPPLTTVTGPLLDLAATEGFGFLPLRGERDHQNEIGVAIPVRGWAIDIDRFQTSARNFFDHNPIGNSNIFIPLTIDRARIRAWEATLQSPRGRRAQVHAAYSHQFVEGRGGITGGLTDFEAPGDDYFFLDHDQRDTLTAGGDVSLDARTTLSASMEYGSGFLQGDGPAHKPAHATASLQASRTIGRDWTVIATALNVTNTHFLLDESNTFGGTHFNSPRQLSMAVRYRFRY